MAVGRSNPQGFSAGERLNLARRCGHQVDLDQHVWLEGAGRLDDWFSNCAALALETLRIPCAK
ncbi:hypothetical protein TRAPUB_6951 [Trametes pubescens]|uniref:Uncharacterized protein n=1 Tax=Trametes pubescens TaxID=154538 RepID=A0A1M2V4K9_TRAPU|nr:hypothetical protein TRAPUB_6951 [Trametes pubescens]